MKMKYINPPRQPTKGKEYVANINEELMEKSDIMEGDKVSVININNDNRFKAIVIKGIRKTGIIGINGDLVNYAKRDDILVILSSVIYPKRK